MNQIIAVARAVSKVNTSSMPRRRPPASATAPSTGESSPTVSPTSACIQAHIACPSTGLAATEAVK